MSPVDPPVPPTGEEIHLPGNSAQPILLTVGLTAILLGVTTSIWLVAGGLLLSLWIIVQWSLDTRREIAELPAHHDHH